MSMIFIKGLHSKANLEISNLHTWFCANRLSLNPQKTKYIVFKPMYGNYNLNNLNVTINGTPLEQIGSQCNEKCTKFLDVYIDESLTWKF